MTLEDLATELKIENTKGYRGLKLYNHIRKLYFEKFKKSYNKPFQSPSISPSTSIQRAILQNTKEFNVYQRSDFVPLNLEKNLNDFFPVISDVLPRTLLFNSGMAAISSLSYLLHGPKDIESLVLGQNSYFETKWLLDDYHKCKKIDEYKLEIPNGSDAYWFEYPINCTSPDEYPFEKQLNLADFFKKFLKIVDKAKKPIYLVLDYTLYFLPFDISRFMKNLPNNLTIFLVTSLQKHRGLGLDLTNGGAITYYSKDDEDYEYLSRVRTIMGASITQETTWLMPAINNKIINQIIKDSGNESRKLFHKINTPNLPITFYCAENEDFQTSFIFVKIDKSLMKLSKSKPYFSDQLMAEFIAVANKYKTTLIQGTSFGFPFTRIFKNSERYTNTDSLRIAVGYDPNFNRNLDKVFTEGVSNFIKKHNK